MQCESCKQEVKDKRTSKQNRALHLYFRLLAEALNEAGYDMKAVIRKEVDIPWTMESVKEYLWRPIQKQYILEKSTVQLSTKNIDEIYDIVNRVIGERTGVFIPFPSFETMYENPT